MKCRYKATRHIFVRVILKKCQFKITNKLETSRSKISFYFLSFHITSIAVKTSFLSEFHFMSKLFLMSNKTESFLFKAKYWFSSKTCFFQCHTVSRVNQVLTVNYFKRFDLNMQALKAYKAIHYFTNLIKTICCCLFLQRFSKCFIWKKTKWSRMSIFHLKYMQLC